MTVGITTKNFRCNAPLVPNNEANVLLCFRNATATPSTRCDADATTARHASSPGRARHHALPLTGPHTHGSSGWRIQKLKLDSCSFLRQAWHDVQYFLCLANCHMLMHSLELQLRDLKTATSCTQFAGADQPSVVW